MNFNKFTIKAQEAIQEAVNMATEHGQQVIEPAHIMGGVLKSNGQTVSFLLQKAGTNVETISGRIDNIIANLPKVSGGEPYLSRESNNVIARAQEIAKRQEDEFVSAEALLLALVEIESPVSALLKNNGVSKGNIEKAIAECCKQLKLSSNLAE